MSQRTLSFVLGLVITLLFGAPLLAQDDLGSLITELTTAERDALSKLPVVYTLECEVIGLPEAFTTSELDPIHLGAFTGAHRLPGFDVFTGTPGFTNATATSESTKDGGMGSCLGISELVAKAYEDVRWPEEGDDPVSFSFGSHRFRDVSHPNLRAMSLDTTYRQDLYDAVKKDTNNVYQRVVNNFRVLTGWGDEECYDRILEKIDDGKVPILIFKGGNVGWHAVNAYKVLHFTNKSLVYFYENNAVYEADEDLHALTVIIYDHEAKTLRMAPWMGHGNVDMKVKGI